MHICVFVFSIQMERGKATERVFYDGFQYEPVIGAGREQIELP